MSLTGFTDSEIGRMQNPPITTVKAPTDQMGEAAVRFLLKRMVEEIEDIHLEIPTELVIRGSTGPAPTK